VLQLMSVETWGIMVSVRDSAIIKNEKNPNERCVLK
jgi:hypothetical protein